MAKKKKAKKKASKKQRQENGVGHEHVLDRLYVVIDSRKGADPDTSYTARLFSRGRQQIAKKLGEEAVEALIEGIRGDKAKLVGESADMLYHLLTLWASINVKPKAVWSELARREGLSGLAEKAVAQAQIAAPMPPPYDRNNVFARILRGEAPLHQGLRGRVRARLQEHPSGGAGACAGGAQGRIRLQCRLQRQGAARSLRRLLARCRPGPQPRSASMRMATGSSPTRPRCRPDRLSFPCPCHRRPAHERHRGEAPRLGDGT